MIGMNEDRFSPEGYKQFSSQKNTSHEISGRFQIEDYFYNTSIYIK